jgi:parvulin-like peptidyl-prolyl isomerase
MRNLLLLGLLLVSAGVQAEEIGSVPAQLDPSEIIAARGGVLLTQQELDAMFSKIPEADRLAFIRNGEKVDQLIKSLLKRKLIAADAVAAGYDQGAMMSARMELAATKELADAWLLKQVTDAPPADYEALAKEDYLANPDSYRSEELLDVSHILLGTKDRTLEEARELAESLVAQLRENPELFYEFVSEYSDDPAKAENGGRYPEVHRGQMVRPFEEAAFSLEKTDDISAPVETEYGYHIIRLHRQYGSELPGFEEIKAQAAGVAEERYLNGIRDRYLRKTLADPLMIPDGAVEIMLKRHLGDDLGMAPGPDK